MCGIVYLPEFIFASADIFVHTDYQNFLLYITLFRSFLYEFHFRIMLRPGLERLYFRWEWLPRLALCYR